jgi:hypothetical protein
VYLDAVRDVRVELGQAVTGALAAPLGLVLDSARWLVNDVTDRYRKLFADLIDRETARTGGAAVPLPRLLTMAAPYLYTHGRGAGELATASVAELQRRWARVLGPAQSPSRHQVSSAEIAARAAGCFPPRPPAWSGARQHSPDIMIAAASPADVERGDFLLVLGEIHLAINTLNQRLFVERHPDPARLIAAEQADRGPGWIVPIPPKDHPIVTSRLSPPSAVTGSPLSAAWPYGEPAENATTSPGGNAVCMSGMSRVTLMPIRRSTSSPPVLTCMPPASIGSWAYTPAASASCGTVRFST